MAASEPFVFHRGIKSHQHYITSDSVQNKFSQAPLLRSVLYRHQETCNHQLVQQSPMAKGLRLRSQSWLRGRGYEHRGGLLHSSHCAHGQNQCSFYVQSGVGARPLCSTGFHHVESSHWQQRAISCRAALSQDSVEDSLSPPTQARRSWKESQAQQISHSKPVGSHYSVMKHYCEHWVLRVLLHLLSFAEFGENIVCWAFFQRMWIFLLYWFLWSGTQFSHCI